MPGPIRLRVRIPAIDLSLAAAAIALVVIGLLTVYSATSVPGAHEGLWIKQLQWAGMAVAAAWVAAAVPYRVYEALAWPFYGGSLLLLVAVLVMGTTAMGARRWLDLGPIHFQPSELAKIATVLLLARLLDDPKVDLRRIRYWLPPIVLTLVPFALVGKEPDLGTSLSFPVLLVAMYYWAGLGVRTLLMALSPVFNVALFFVTGSLWWFAGLFVALLAAARPRPLILILVVALNGAGCWSVPQTWDRLHCYQTRRIETFPDPSRDP